MNIDARILSLYGKGMSYGDIQDHLKEMYDVEISVGTLNAITDRIIPEILEWQARTKKYNVIFRSWRANWDRLINFYKYPPALKRVV